jgi:hypothetical protein
MLKKVLLEGKMKIKIKRIFLLLLLMAGSIWNVFCILDIFPRSFSTVSVLAVTGYSLAIVFVPLFTPDIIKTGEKSNFIQHLTKKEKHMSYVTICLVFVWLATLISSFGFTK